MSSTARWNEPPRGAWRSRVEDRRNAVDSSSRIGLPLATVPAAALPPRLLRSLRLGRPERGQRERHRTRRRRRTVRRAAAVRTGRGLWRRAGECRVDPGEVSEERPQLRGPTVRVPDPVRDQRQHPRPHRGAHTLLTYVEQLADLLQSQARQLRGRGECQPVHRLLAAGVFPSAPSAGMPTRRSSPTHRSPTATCSGSAPCRKVSTRPLCTASRSPVPSPRARAVHTGLARAGSASSPSPSRAGPSSKNEGARDRRPSRRLRRRERGAGHRRPDGRSVR